MLRVGLVGCGTIGSQLAVAIDRGLSHAARVVALHDADREHARALQRRLASRPPILPISLLIRRSDLVVEAASADAAGPLVERALRRNRSVFVMSVGGLLRRQTWRRLATRSKGRVHIPSGALAGLDGVQALALGRIRRATLTTCKPPAALAGAPYVRRRGLRLDRLTKATVIFEGSAREVVRSFPQNTNVAAALTLASGLPAGRVKVRVVADPAARTNRHEVDVEGDAGRIQCRIQSRPSANPKTSELAVRSAVATMRRLFDPVVIGT